MTPKTWPEMLAEQSILGQMLRDHREAIESAFGYATLPTAATVSIEAVIDSVADGGDEDPANWLGALVLHSEAVHGCDHTDQAREEAGLPPRLGIDEWPLKPGGTTDWPTIAAAAHPKEDPR